MRIKRKNQIFILRPSKVHGIGVFTNHPIQRGEKIKLFDGKDWEYITKKKKAKLCDSNPSLSFFFDRYCVETRRGYWKPISFMRMSPGWYLNHSGNPNIMSKNGELYYATRDIKEGEELFTDYEKLDRHINNWENIKERSFA